MIWRSASEPRNNLLQPQRWLYEIKQVLVNTVESGYIKVIGIKETLNFPKFELSEYKEK